jgi:putative ABC transport system substrate-binding protein
MWFVLKRVSRGLVLIAGASAVLLASDMKRSRAGHLPRIAILQHTSTPALDDGVRGILDDLAQNGYRDGETAHITTYNAQGEMATANAIAREITDGRFDLVITSSTSSLQAVANANRAGRTPHVFGLVADPWAAGVGLDRANRLARPRHLVGYSLILPVGDGCRMAKRMLPTLTRIGVAWNPAEVNSRVLVELARTACQELGITLVEAQVENPAGVREAIQSVIGRGAQVVWVGGDTTVASALDTVLATARQARVPVFSLLPTAPDRGTIFDLGFDYYEAGRMTGELAAQVLKGTDPGTIPIRDALDLVPRRLFINRKALEGLKEPWRVSAELLREANAVVDDAGVHWKAGTDGGTPRKP